jgi:hypothetical protein
VAVRDFRVEAGQLVLVCTQCAAETTSEAAAGITQTQQRAANAPAPAAPTPPAPAAPKTQKVVALHKAPERVVPVTEAPEGFCPKCVAARTLTDVHCKACGLQFEKYVASEHRPSALLADTWEALAQRWGDGSAHDAFLSAALARGELAQAGRLYRIRLAHAPNDPMAVRAREEVLRMAALQHPLVSEKASALPVENPVPRVQRFALWGAIVVSLLIFGWILLSRMPR